MLQVSSKKTDIFLTQKITYSIAEPLDTVWHRLNDFTSDRRWFPAVNVSGNFDDDGSFTLTPQWSFTAFSWIERSPAYLSGRFQEEGNHTAVHVTLRPNSLTVIILYLMGILFVLTLLGKIDVIKAPRPMVLSFFPLFSLLLYGIAYWQTEALRRNFEKIMTGL